MKKWVRSRIGAAALSLVVAFAMSAAGLVGGPIGGLVGTVAFAAEDQSALKPADDSSYVAKVIEQLGGEDGLYKKGLNGFDMYEHLGLVYMGWRTTGGTWQNEVIGNYIMSNLKEAGFTTTDADVEAPYGEKPASDKSSATDDDYAWEIRYQGTEKKNLGNAWDPEYSSLDVQLVKKDGTPVNDAVANTLAQGIGGSWWSYNPTTEVYQKNFAAAFGMDYDRDIASLPTTKDKVAAMHRVLMKSDVEKDKRTSVDDYTYIKRDSIASPNKEALLNQRTRMAWDSCFTDPAGTDPAAARGTDGEFIYVGTVDNGNNTNSEGIAADDIAGKIILTDSTMQSGFWYAQANGAVGVASKAAVAGFLSPRDEEGRIMYPWYDSSRYARGGTLKQTMALTEAGTPIVEWQFSNRQYDDMRALLERAKTINASAADEADKVKVTGHQVAIGQAYPMTKTAGKPGLGQAVAIAEVKGCVHPEKRIMICAHVQEPGCNDNATGVAALLGVATAYKQMVDEGKIPRPKCTITFMWGDEMNMASYWMDGHQEETANLIGALDMDMTGEDPEKTGGVMRIEKTPDPSALYGYTLDAVPWDEPDEEIPSRSNPYYNESYASSRDGSFVRLPDSHTLWGTGEVGSLFQRGWYLNDLYMYVTSSVIKAHDPNFQVDVCPFEGGSDHEAFLEEQIPAVLTWHFTDYTYHTSVDNLYMSSPRELESVGLTTLTTALVMGDLCDDSDGALEILAAVREAAMKRMLEEQTNTLHHRTYAEDADNHVSYEEALANEKRVLKAWGDWYAAAFDSVATLMDTPSLELSGAIAKAKEDLAAAVEADLAFADQNLDLAVARTTAIDAIDEGVAESNVPKQCAKLVDGVVAEAREAIAAENVISNIYQIQSDALTEINAIVAPSKAKVTGVKAKSKKSRITVSWKQTCGVTGYQVVYKMKGAKKFKTLKTTKATKVTTKKLTKGKKYQFKVRTYTLVKGTRIYGPYSKAKTVKCK